MIDEVKGELEDSRAEHDLVWLVIKSYYYYLLLIYLPVSFLYSASSAPALLIFHSLSFILL